MNPESEIDAGHSMQTVFLTAGDGGLGAGYWQSREAGVMAAFAQMAGVANSWTLSTLTVNGRNFERQSLTGPPEVSVVFMRLPDGNANGLGFLADNSESLEHLWKGSIPTIHAIDGSTSYSKVDLVNTLAGIMASFQPDIVYTQDYVGTYGMGDHSDHYSAAYLTRSASRVFKLANRRLIGYLGYPVLSHPPNVPPSLLNDKIDAFLTYAPFDFRVPQTRSQLSFFGAWMARQYFARAGSKHHAVPRPNESSYRP